MRPFRRVSDSYCSLVSSLATIFILLMCTVLRTGSIVEALRLSDVQPSLYLFLDFDLTQVLAHAPACSRPCPHATPRLNPM